MDQKPHWLISEIAAICVVGLVLYIAWLWQSANSFEGLKSSAAFHYRRKDYNAAIPLYQRLIAASQSAKRPENKEFAGNLADLAHCYFSTDRDKLARPLLERTLVLREKLLKHDDGVLAGTLYELAYCNMEEGKYSQAIPLYERSIAIYEKKSKNRDLAFSLEGLGYVYYMQQKYSDAIPPYERALKIRGTRVTDSSYGNSVNNLANAYYKQGLYSKAEPLFQSVLDYNKSNLQKTDPALTQSYKDLAECYKAEGKTEDAQYLESQADSAQPDTH